MTKTLDELIRLVEKYADGPHTQGYYGACRVELVDALRELIADAERLRALHTTLVDDKGYEWGVAAVKFENGRPVSVLWGLSDHSDLDAVIAARKG